MEVPTSRQSIASPILVKRYVGLRLYDATNGRYVSVAQLRRWAADSVVFIVIDAETGVDVTRVVLA